MDDKSHVRYLKGQLSLAKDCLLSGDMNISEYNSKVRELRLKLKRYGVEI